MAQTVNPTRLASEVSSATSVTPQAPAPEAVAAAATAAATGISNVSVPEAVFTSSHAVAQQVLPQGGQEVQAFVAKLPPKLVLQGQAFAQEIAANPSSPDLQARWADYVSQVNAGSPAGMDVGGLVQWVLRESYMQSTEDLRFYAEKVKFFNELKKQIRDELTTARTALADMSTAANAWASANDGDPKDFSGFTYTKTEFDTTAVQFDADGNPAVRSEQSTLTKKDGSPATREDFEAYIKGLEEKLSSVGDDAQLANVDLQNTLQKQQQTLQMMSNISKMLNDTAMAIIRKIG